MAYTTSWLEEESSGSYGTNSMTFTAIVPLHITKIIIDVFPSRDTTNSRFTIAISDNQGSETYTSDIIYLPDNTSGVVERYEVPVNFIGTIKETSISSTITLKFTATNYAATTRVTLTDEQKILYAGGTTVATTWAFPCSIEYEVIGGPVWELLDNVDFVTLTSNPYEEWLDWERDAVTGLPKNPYIFYISSLTDTPVNRAMKVKSVEGWTRDKYGYPLNSNIWRIDNNNLGYPWIWGYAQRILAVNLTFGEEDGLIHVKKKKGKIQFKKDYDY